MIKKDVLINKINELISSEEQIMPLLKDHINSALTFSGVEEAQINELQQSIDKMALMENAHIDFLKDIVRGLTDREESVL